MHIIANAVKSMNEKCLTDNSKIEFWDIVYFLLVDKVCADCCQLLLC